MVRILRGEASEAEVAAEHGVDSAVVRQWTRLAFKGARAALGASPRAQESEALRSPWTTIAGTAAVGLTWLTLRLYFWNGYYTEDSPGYVTEALQTLTGGFIPRTHVNGLNIGTYLPVVVPLALLGKTEAALSVWPMLCSLLGMVSLGLACKAMWGVRWGLLAAFLYACYPGDVFFSTVVMPDAIQAGLLSLSFALSCLALTGVGAGRRRKLFAAGLALGACHLVRSNDVLLVPSVLLSTGFLAWHARLGLGDRLRCAWVVLVGWTIVVIAESLLYHATAGDAWLRIRVISGHYGSTDSLSQWGLNHDRWTLPYSLFPPWLWARFGGWWRLNQDQAFHGMLFSLATLTALAAATVGIARRTRSPQALALAATCVFFCWPLLYHQFGTQSLLEFVPIHRLSRHFVVYAPGAIVMLVGSAAFLFDMAPVRGVPRLPRLSVCGGALTLLLWLNWQGMTVAHQAYMDVKSTYLRIRAHLPAGTKAIVADPGDLCFFDFWMNPASGPPTVMLIPFESVSDCGALPEGVVLTHANRGWQGLEAVAIRTAVARLPCLLEPPASWVRLNSVGTERIYWLTAQMHN